MIFYYYSSLPVWCITLKLSSFFWIKSLSFDNVQSSNAYPRTSTTIFYLIWILRLFSWFFPSRKIKKNLNIWMVVLVLGYALQSRSIPGEYYVQQAIILYCSRIILSRTLVFIRERHKTSSLFSPSAHGKFKHIFLKGFFDEAKCNIQWHLIKMRIIIT